MMSTTSSKMMDPILDAVLDLLDKKEEEESHILNAMLKIKELDVEDDDDQKDAPLHSLEKVHAVIEERKKKVSEKIASFFADIKVSTVDDIMFVQRENYVCSFDKETEFDEYEEEFIMDVICAEFETIRNRPPSMGEIVSIMVEAAEIIRSSRQSNQDGVFRADFDAAKNVAVEVVTEYLREYTEAEKEMNEKRYAAPLKSMLNIIMSK